MCEEIGCIKYFRDQKNHMHGSREIRWWREDMNVVLLKQICIHSSTYIHSFVNPHTFICQPTYTFIRQPTIQSFDYLLLHSFVNLLIHSFVNILMHSFVNLLMHSFVNLLLHSFVNLLMHSFVNLLMHSSINLLLHSFVKTICHKPYTLMAFQAFWSGWTWYSSHFYSCSFLADLRKKMAPL